MPNDTTPAPIGADALREALWICVEHNALHFGETHNTVVQGRAALASAAQQAALTGDPAEPRDDSDRIYDRPVGYLPAYELSRLHSGHGAQLRSAKFGPSALDGDVPVYLESSALALVQALIGAQRAINSMKVEAETAAQGDEQMMLDACEQISNEGLEASLAIQAVLSTAAQSPVDGALNTIAAMFHSGEEIEGPDGMAMMVDMSVWNDALDAFEGIIGDEMEPVLQPERVPLTDKEIADVYFVALGSQHLLERDRGTVTRFARAVEEHHGIKPKEQSND